MCAALTGREATKSNLVPINTPGQAGKFEIPYGDMLYQFQCSTATYQPCKSTKGLTQRERMANLFFTFRS